MSTRVRTSNHPAHLLAIFLVGIGLMTFLLVKIVPVFEEVYAKGRAFVPWPTRLVIRASHMLSGDPLRVAISVGLAATLFIGFALTQAGHSLLVAALRRLRSDDALWALIQPLVIVVIAAVLLAIISALYTPIFILGRDLQAQ